MGTTAPTSWREAILANSDPSDLDVPDDDSPNFASLKPFYGAGKTDASSRLESIAPLDVFIIKDALQDGKFGLIHGVLPAGGGDEENTMLFHTGFGANAQVHRSTVESLFDMCDGMRTPKVENILATNKKKDELHSKESVFLK